MAEPKKPRAKKTEGKPKKSPAARAPRAGGKHADRTAASPHEHPVAPRVRSAAAAAAAADQSPDQLDVLVVGAHPAAHFAAAALAHDQPKLRLAHVVPPGDAPADRLLVVNARLLDLHPLLKHHAALSGLPSAAGLQFLSETPGVRGEYVSARKPAMLVASVRQATDVMRGLADAQRVRRTAPAAFAVERVVDDGVRVSIDGRPCVARVLIVAASNLPPDQQRALGIATGWEDDVLHRYAFLRLRAGPDLIAPPGNHAIPMSLDLAGTGAWAWMLFDGESGTSGPKKPAAGNGHDVQLALQQPMRTLRSFPPERLMRAWIGQLAAHAIVRSPEKLMDRLGEMLQLDVPVAGALSSETVANRTLLIGPAGGFYSACGEDLYPACWSAAAAVAVVGRAIKATHVQDALQSYRQQWGTTLGDYLRGPQQNLTLLLPLIYKNAVMAARVGDAILFGESVVR